MNFANFDLFKLAENARISIIKLHNVYSRIISKYFNRQLISNRKEIINFEKDEKNFKTDLLTYQFYFLFTFGIQDTLLSARKFYDSVLYHLEIMQKLSEQNPLNLLCLESEALPTVIGVCQVINEIVSIKIMSDRTAAETANPPFREIQILVIDTRQNWRRLCEYIVDEFNSYFYFIKLKLDFVDHFTSLSSQKLIELDLVVVARIFTEGRTFPQNYSSIQIILDKLKKNAVLFYFDSCKGRYYADLKCLISETHLFSQVFIEVLSLQNLRKEHTYFDRMHWDNGFQPVMFSTWRNDCSSVSKDKKKGKTSAKTSKKKIVPKSTTPKVNRSTKSRKKMKYLPIKLNNRIIKNKTGRKIKFLDNFPRMKEEGKTNLKTFKTNTAGEKLSHIYPQKKYKYLYRKSFKTNTAGEKLSRRYPQKKYKYLYHKKKSNGIIVKRNKVIKQFVIMRLQIKCKHSERKQKGNAETIETSKAVQNLGSSNQQSKKEYKNQQNKKKYKNQPNKKKYKNQQNKKKYKCPHLRTEETVSNYADFLSEIYYFKHLKKGKYFNDNIRHIPKNLIYYE